MDSLADDLQGLDDLTLETVIRAVSLLTPQQVKAVQQKIRTLDNFPLEETKTRNILMLGRSGSGKTTAIDVIKDPCALPRPQSLFSDTVGARFQSFSLDDKKSLCKYSVNIIDTPGVQEVKPRGESARSDDAILETIKYCLKNEITRIHTLLIFAGMESRLSPLDYAAFKIYLDMFYDKKVNIAFCITKAEGKPQEWKDQIVKDLQADSFFGPMLEKHDNIKIFFTGCVTQLRVDEAPDIKSLFSRYNEIYNARQDLLSFIFSSADEGVMLMSLPIVSSHKKQMSDMLAMQNDIIAKLSSTTDFGTGTIKNLIDTFDDNVGYMIANDGLFNEPSLYAAFVELKAKLRALIDDMKRKKCPPALITNLSGRIIL